jgi:diacylglycerol kinase (ATP)
MVERRLLFILNPKAGKGKALEIAGIIKDKMPSTIPFSVEMFTDSDEFENLMAKKHQFTDLVAAGGDGTINSVARNLVGTDIALGIIPLGSGNGLARSLGISMGINEAIAQIVEGKKIKIDHGTVNNIPFFCTSGIGFDAHIGNLFARSKERGLQSYIDITLREIIKYKAKDYTLKLNGQELKRKAFFITVANAGQYGNDFYIAPNAKMNDGKFHVVILRPPGFFGAFGVLWKVLNGRANTSRYIETLVTDKLIVEREHKDAVHFDGEPEFLGEKLEFVCHSQKLMAIVGRATGGF